MVVFTVEVTGEDIAKGIQRNARLCPIAIAVNRVKLGRSAMVWDEIAIRPTSEDAAKFWDVYEMPYEAKAWRQAFDEGKSVEPFTFTARLRNRTPYSEER